MSLKVDRTKTLKDYQTTTKFVVGMQVKAKSRFGCEGKYEIVGVNGNYLTIWSWGLGKEMVKADLVEMLPKEEWI